MGSASLKGDSSDPKDPGPLIDVIVMNSRDVLEAWRAAGLDCPPPIKVRALLDTGAAFTIISKTFARHCKLRQTGETEVKVLGTSLVCGDHAGSIDFPGTSLGSLNSIRIRSGDFIREPNFACLIGRDILRNWTITFDGRRNRVMIAD